MTIKKVKDTVTPKLRRMPAAIRRVHRELLIGFVNEVTRETEASRWWRVGKPAMRAGLNRRKHAKKPTPAPVMGSLTSRHGMSGLRGAGTFSIDNDGSGAWIHLKSRGTTGADQRIYGAALAKRNPRWNFVWRGLKYAWNKALPKFKKKWDSVVKS